MKMRYESPLFAAEEGTPEGVASPLCDRISQLDI
jgi:hypothetical protein